MLRAAFSILFSFVSLFIFAQNATIYGNVRDELNKPLSKVSIVVSENEKGTITDDSGNFELAVTSGKDEIVTFSSVGYENFVKTVHLIAGQRFPLYVVMTEKTYQLNDITIQENELRDQPSMQKIDVSKFEALPSASGGVESILKILGAQSNNELSSQYSVRGGNFDENLVYVNGFEIYRPFLVSSSQQEGLSFVNPDLVSSLLFSAGGFPAKYGDKISSVLDINYKKPDHFEGTAGISLLGANASIGNASKNKKFTYLFGARYKSNQYLLNALPTQGDYRPTFTDFQAYLTYKINDRWSLEGLANYSGNRFLFIPEDEVTTFGTIQETLRLTVFFDGQELDRYENGMAGVALNFQPRKNLNLKLLTSFYKDREDETFDIIGQYFLGEVNTNLGSSAFGQTAYYIGVGTNQNWGRDYLDATVYKLALKATWLDGAHFVQAGADVNRELIDYQLNEWVRQDSAGYALPYSPEAINLQDVIHSKFIINSFRYSGYLQDAWTLNETRDFILTFGGRFNYWTENNQLIFSPRAQLSYKPQWKRDLVFRAAIGAYDQPPFFRELVDLYGNLHPDVKAQRSIHFVLGSDWNFQWLDRPFKFVSEVYYKDLYDLNPYELDNVRIRYYGTNDAIGYAYGVDLRLNGEVVKDAESYVSVDFLNTKENLTDDYLWKVDTTFFDPNHTEYKLDSTKIFPGYIPRPTDQRVTFALFFQDYIPGNENFKVHLNLVFGTGLPTGPPDHIRARDTLRLTPYRRVDIGFSALLVDGKKHQQSEFLKHIQNAWLQFEIFNLFDVQNEISYSWVKTTNNLIYAVPNYLTGRRFNLRLQVKFD